MRFLVLALSLLFSISAFSARVKNGTVSGKYVETGKKCSIKFKLGLKDYAYIEGSEYQIIEVEKNSFNDCEGYDRCVFGEQLNEKQEKRIVIYMNKNEKIEEILIDPGTMNQNAKYCHEFKSALDRILEMDLRSL